ncbi:MAG: serine/threonine-protein kinase [Bacteroidota bacterium]|nr:serine/threonine-protein kinase [Bacteroidota bacterium]
MNDTQFKIEQKINESSTTIVYRAFDEVLHRTVLLKVLHKHLANDPDLRQRFMREARACAALQSEHIVQVYDLTEIDGAPAIVMEFVEGKSLKDVIASGENANLEFAKKTAIHLLRALSIAHERGIIHRDIKPGNILLSENGTLKVTDFGLAYVALSPIVTMEGMVLGTPAYMAPEQVRGDEVDTRTDLFALGVTLIEVLSGERIFEGSTYTECMKKVLAFKTEELDRFDLQSNPEFSQFLRKLLNPNKNDRFSSAREALDVIDERKSSTIVPPIFPQNNNIYITVGITAIALLAIIIFGWTTLLSPSQTEYIKPKKEIPVTNSQKVQTSEVVNEKPASISEMENVVKPKDENNDKRNDTVSRMDSGRVYITSMPWAKVYVNNELIGETPISKPIILAAGSNTVMFSNPSFDPIVKTIIVESNRDISVAGDFMESAGYVMCVVHPWAEVYVDEQYKNITPLEKPIMLSAGKHSIRFKNSAFTDLVKEVIVKAKDTIHVSMTFTK